jgi:undecaprenyl diphosphate synthase
MDGNGRWARQRHRPRSFGHRAGQKAVQAAIEFCVQHGVQALTLFAFSSENWQRPPQEVSALMELFLKALDREVDKLHGNGVRIAFIGELAAFAPELRERMRAAMTRTAGNSKLALNIAVNYGGRWDVANAAKRAALAGPARRTCRRGDRRAQPCAVFLPCGPAARRSFHPDRRRTARQQFSSLAAGL